jgi:hypothetical protein
VSESLLSRIGVSGYNKPKRTPKHPTKSHVVVAKLAIRSRLFGSDSRVLAGLHQVKASQMLAERDGHHSRLVIVET